MKIQPKEGQIFEHYHAGRCEIVGNIHENKELLKCTFSS